MTTLIKKYLLKGCLIVLASLPFHAIAQPVTVDVTSGAGGQAVAGGNGAEIIIRYMENLGLYFGFNIKEPPQQPVKTNILDADTSPARKDLSNLVNSYLGAIINAVDRKDKDNIFLPSIVNTAQSINGQANSTLTSWQSAKDSTTEATVNQLIDQKTFQADPVSQSLLNILGTPDDSWCKQDMMKPGARDCTLLSRNKIVNNVLGIIPAEPPFYSYEANKDLLNQLNSNSLTSPLLYSNKDASTTSNNKTGLKASSQEAQAGNFVRYALADVLPLQLISYEDYAALYRQYHAVMKGSKTESDIRGKNILESYLASLRIYTAQRSVAISNLYDIMSKRMLQAPRSDSGQNSPTSEALSQFTMAAWRLKNLGDGKGDGPSQQWLEKINTASTDTVQKEIAILLAEMNYQMYLSRQQQEKILLTNTMILLENMKGNEPSLREIRERFAMQQAAGQPQVGP